MAIGVRPIGSRAIGDGATVLTGAYAGGGGTTFTISLIGAITSSGSLSSVSSSGGIVLAGVLSLAGALQLKVIKALASVVAPTGVVTSPSFASELAPGFLPITRP